MRYATVTCTGTPAAPRRHRAARVLTAIVGAGLVVGTAGARSAQPTYYSDDPIWTVPETQDASGVEPWSVNLLYDITSNLFARPGDPQTDVRAQNVNTVDEVPDSSWFTGRAGRQPLTADEVERGPDTSDGPAPGRWTVTAAKTDGVTPGFTIRDAKGDTWFIKFDPPGHRGMATGTEVVVTKLFWALGFFVPENHLARLRPDELEIGSSATFTPPGGAKRPMRRSDIRRLLARAEPEEDGSYRVIASRAVAGKPLGPFRFDGTRPDDPNDLVPHEHRRELRGYRTFAAWVNHVDAKAGNTLDALVDVDGRSLVRHYLLDFGSTLGSAALYPRPYWEGYEYMVQPRDIGRGIATLGFIVEPWRTVKFYEAPSVGRLPFENREFDPDAWRPRVPNPAFVRARGDDHFWAARILSAMGDDLIRAAVAMGRFGDEESEAFLVRALIERRDAIVRAYLPAVNPIVEPRLAGGALEFRNAAVDARVAEAPEGYRATWRVFDNATGAAGEAFATTDTFSTRVAAPAIPPDARFVQVEVTSAGRSPAAWAQPVTLVFRRAGDGFDLVGLTRLP